MSSLLQQTGHSCRRNDEVRGDAIFKDIITIECSNNSPSAAIDLDTYELNNEALLNPRTIFNSGGLGDTAQVSVMVV